jgi:hypothetical protein
MDAKTLDQIKTQYYGATGTPERDRLERELDKFRKALSSHLVEQRKRVK